MHSIQIDSEFQALIPPLSAEERAQLEANIVADGCRDPLVVWGDVLIDGHNRYEICTRLRLPFEVVPREFESRDNATEWIINNQFGRRNLSDYQRGVLALRMKPIIEARALAKMLAGVSSNPSEISHEGTQEIFSGEVKQAAPVEAPKPAIRTDEAVASLANISSNTIRKIEHIEEVAAPEVKALAAAGDVSINLAAQFTDLPQETQQEALAAIAQSEPAKEVMREAVHNHRAQGTGENEWYTPQTHLDAAYEVLGGIDLDPASSEIANKTVQADRIFTVEDDGLTKEWAGRVWMNPPYAQPFIAQFVEKLASEYEAGRVTEAISLTHNYTDTVWFHRAAKSCAAICFTRGRIGFLSPEGKRAAPTQGQAFFYYGSKVAEFVSSFSRIGFVVEVRND